MITSKLTTNKVRRVGHSNVVTLPRELEGAGYAPGADVVVNQLPDGTVTLMLAGKVRDQLVQQAIEQVVAENREALAQLAAYDQARS